MLPCGFAPDRRERSKNWELYPVDFSRSFRTKKGLRNPQDLFKCDRQLLEKLKALDATQLAEKTKHYLTKDEVKAVKARRDKIVERFQEPIAEKRQNQSSVLKLQKSHILLYISRRLARERHLGFSAMKTQL
jgi:hypothetical protein